MNDIVVIDGDHPKQMWDLVHASLATSLIKFPPLLVPELMVLQLLFVLPLVHKGVLFSCLLNLLRVIGHGILAGKYLAEYRDSLK